MFNADCHVGIVYLIMCKPTTILHGFAWFLKQYCTIAVTALACVYVLQLQQYSYT